MNQTERGLRFRQLHAAGSIFLMPNAWGEGSALMLASLGFPAVATTSAGVCFTLGFPDQDSAVSKATMLERVGAIAAALRVPVSADLQSGYGADPDEVGSTIASAVRAGVVGGSLARAAFGLIRKAAVEMAEPGTFSYATQQIPHAELSRFFADQRER